MYVKSLILTWQISYPSLFDLYYVNSHCNIIASNMKNKFHTWHVSENTCLSYNRWNARNGRKKGDCACVRACFCARASWFDYMNVLPICLCVMFEVKKICENYDTGIEYCRHIWASNIARCIQKCKIIGSSILISAVSHTLH